MIFRMLANVEFEADDISDALRKLGEYFTRIGYEDDEEEMALSIDSIFIGGKIEVKPIGDKHERKRHDTLQSVV